MTSSRTRLAAIVAIVGLLVGGSIGVGALVAVAQPNAIAITTPTGNVVGPGWTGVDGTVDWTDAGSGGSVAVTVVNSAGTNTFCAGSNYTAAQETWNCVPTLQYGSNTITATATETDDPDNPLSTASPIVITYGGMQAAAITSPPDASTNSTATTFAGTGSEMGTVNLRARPVGSTNPADFVDICASTPVNAAGNWSCLATFPERRVWTVQAQSVTLTGVDYGAPDSQTFTFNNQRPDTTVVSTPGLLRLDATPGATGSSVSTRWQYYADAGSGGDLVIDCGTAATQACVVPGAPLPGLYLASSNAYANDAGSSDRGDFVRIPAAPVITNADDGVTGQLSITGTFDPTFSEPFGQVDGNGTPVVDVIDADSSAVLCGEIELDVTGDWNCTTPAPPGTFDYVAIARTSTPIGASNAQDVFSAGTSSRSNVVTTTVSAGGLAITSPTPDGGSSEWLFGPTSFTVSGSSTLTTTVDVLFDGAPIGTSCSDLPVTAGEWMCTTALSAGEYDITATQLGSFDVEVAWTVTIPEPVVANDDPYVIDSYGTADYSGTIYYTPGDIVVEVEVSDGGYETCDPTYGPGDIWDCSVDMYGYDDGVYNVRTYIVDGSERSDYVYSTLIIGDEPVAPPLNCTFGPGGAFSVSSDESLDYLEIYGLLPPEEGSYTFDSYAAYTTCDGSAGHVFPEGTEFDTFYVDGCYTNCGSPATVSAESLAPGNYVVDQQISDGGESVGFSFEPHNWVFRIPSAPTITTALSTTNSVVLNGTATAGDAVRIVRPAGTELCETTATDSGTWACQFPKSSTSSARAISIDASSGGMSAYSASRDFAVLVPPTAPTPVPTLAPEPEITLVQWLLTFGGDLSNLKPGDKFTLNISGMPEGTAIEIWIHSTPQLLGTAVGTGAPMAIDLVVPTNIENGAHEIEMIGVTPLGTQYFYTSEAMVTGGTEPVIEEPLKVEPVLDEKPGGSGGLGDRTEPAAPSALSDGLAPVSAIVANPASIAIAGGLALALLFLVALPTELLNSSLSSNTSRLGRVYGTVDGALTKAQDWFIKVTRSRAIAAAVLTTAVAIIYGFVDPDFGFDIVSLRLVLSLAIAFFLLSFVASWISGMIIRRAWGAMGVIAMQPSIILFAIVGVIVARVLEFSPGFLVGIAIGLELLQASRTVSARAVFVQIAVVTGLALAAWGIYSVFTPGDDFAGMLVEDTMVAVTAEGLTGALIALFPLRFLDGHDLWAVSKRLWVLAFLIVATAFALLVLPTAIHGTDVADYGVWLLVFAVFGLGSLAVWLIFVRADKKAAEAEKESVDA